eukprot:12364526-Alexandrium_andersonii.AAC.1
MNPTSPRRSGVRTSATPASAVGWLSAASACGFRSASQTRQRGVAPPRSGSAATWGEPGPSSPIEA